MKKRGVLRNWGYLLKNIAETDKLLFLLIFACVPIAILMPYLQAFLPRAVIEGLQNKTELQSYLLKILLIAMALAVTVLLEQTVKWLLEMKGQDQRGRFSKELRKHAIKVDYEKMAAVSFAQSFDLSIEAIAGDIAITGQSANITANFLTSLLGIIAFAPLIITIQPILILIIFISFLTNYFYGIFLTNYDEKITEQNKGVNRKLHYIAYKSINYKYAKDIRLYKMSDWFLKSYQTYNNERRRWERKLSGKRFLGDLIAGLFVFIRDGLAYFYLITQIFTGKIGIAQFVFLFPIITSFSDWLISLSTQITELRTGSLKLDYLRNFFDTCNDNRKSKGSPLPVSFNIELKNVSYKYPESDKLILKDINLNIKQNEKIAIVGVNGAGKTTLINLIMNLFFPTQGDVFIGGKNTKDYSQDELLPIFGAVFQETFIPPETIKNIICASSDSHDETKFQKAVKDSGFEKTILELPQKENTYLVKSTRKEAVDLSGGQNQRLMLARVLYRDAPILILDEPTAALDPIAESEIYEHYNKMTQNKTSIFISHRLASTRFCDRIILIEDGKIIEEGTHESLMAKGGKYAEMFNIQSTYYTGK